MGRKKELDKWEIRKCEACATEFEVYKKNLKRYCSKKCASSDVRVKRKIVESQQKTFNEKYGCHPMKTEKTMRNFEKSMVLKYGVKNALKSEYIMNGMKNTVKKKYGVECVFQSKDIIEKSRKTKLAKYGNENYNNQLIKYEVYDKFLNLSDIKPLFSRGEYEGTFPEKKYKFECRKCGNIMSVSIYAGYIPRCKRCNTKTISNAECEIVEYIRGVYGGRVVVGDREILNGKELDIYIPDKKLAIEYNGLYWHSELNGGKNKYYHLNKTEKCSGEGIKLIHIFDYEWKNKRNIIQSLIRNGLGISERLYARKCEIKEISIKQKNEFLNKNHIQGSGRSGVRVGLFFQKELVAVMTFGRSRFDKRYKWEIIRFATKIGHSIVGGASKMFSYFMNNYNPVSIITYSDKRFGGGNVYEKIGMDFVKSTTPSYFYFRGGELYSRFQFQKHKLSKKLNEFDENLTEWENMIQNGYDRIWDCGHNKYEIIF